MSRQPSGVIVGGGVPTLDAPDEARPGSVGTAYGAVEATVLTGEDGA